MRRVSGVISLCMSFPLPELYIEFEYIGIFYFTRAQLVRITSINETNQPWENTMTIIDESAQRRQDTIDVLVEDTELAIFRYFYDGVEEDVTEHVALLDEVAAQYGVWKGGC